MKYIGYRNQTELPFKKGDTVFIPAGITVKSMNPSVSSYVTKRKQIVKIHHILCGMEVNDAHYQRYHEKDSHICSYEKFIESSDGGKYSVGIWHVINNPQIVWAGSGGYWNEVDINDILVANGIEV